MQPKRFANKRKKYHCPLSLLHPVTVTYSKLTHKKGKQQQQQQQNANMAATAESLWPAGEYGNRFNYK